MGESSFQVAAQQVTWRGTFYWNKLRGWLRIVLGCSMVLTLVPVSIAQSGREVLFGGPRFKNATIAICKDRESAPSAIIRVEQVHTDYQRKGFFRVGLLPVCVLEGVAFEIQNTCVTSNGFAQIHKWLRAESAKRLELRRATIQWASLTTNSIEAGRILISPAGTWELSDGVKLRISGKLIQSKRATLQAAGSRAGELLMGALPEWKGNVLYPTLPTTDNKDTP